MTTLDTLSLIRPHLANIPAHETKSIMSELQAHLADKAAALQAQGHPNANSAASVAFGDPETIGAQLADIHGRPTRRHLLLAVLPFIVTGFVLPVAAFAVAALDAPKEPFPGYALNILGLTVQHTGTFAVLAFLVLSIGALLAAGAVVGMRQRLPLWSTTWIGSVLLCIILFVQLLLDETPVTTGALANLILLAAITATLLLVARQRGGVTVVLIPLSLLFQARIISAIALAGGPLGMPAVQIPLGAATVIVACLATAAVLHQRSGYLAIALVAAVLALSPDVLRLAAHGRAGIIIPALFLDYIMPSVFFVIPYLLRRRDPVTG